MNNNQKRLFLKQFVSCENAIDELMVYTQNKFIDSKQKPVSNTTEFIKTWEAYDQESQKIGCFNTLKKYLVQLQFPVKKGISKTEDYNNVTLRGKQKQSNEALELCNPDAIALELYDCEITDKIPVIIAPDDKDFNTIICALSNKNEPKQLPDAMGALCINGINNWDRIHKIRRKWLKRNPFGNWNSTFKKHIQPKPYLFKDRLIVLSTKGYSGISSQDLGMSKKEWQSSSLSIRRAHECAHLFTLQHYGCMANNMHDEIIADYAGITKVLGTFNKDWFLRFMGLEGYPNYRRGGRLENYQAPIPLSKDAFNGLQLLVKNISDTIISFDSVLGNINTPQDRLNRIKSICEVDMLTMASSIGLDKLLEKYRSKSF